MIERIKQSLWLQYKLTEPRGVFFSVFDAQDVLLLSSGVAITDKPLDAVIDMLYHGLIQSHIDATYIICDVIKDIELQTSMEDVMHIDMNIFGICVATVDHTKSGVVLPATVGINTVSDALTFIKHKNHLTGNISIYKFTTDRISII